jgi:hypothetical protein
MAHLLALLLLPTLALVRMICLPLQMAPFELFVVHFQYLLGTSQPVHYVVTATSQAPWNTLKESDTRQEGAKFYGVCPVPVTATMAQMCDSPCYFKISKDLNRSSCSSWFLVEFRSMRLPHIVDPTRSRWADRLHSSCPLHLMARGGKRI